MTAKLLEILACPACDDRPAVKQDGDFIVCAECGRKYPIRDGIPVMLVDEATISTANDQHAVEA